MSHRNFSTPFIVMTPTMVRLPRIWSRFLMGVIILLFPRWPPPFLGVVRGAAPPLSEEDPPPPLSESDDVVEDSSNEDGGSTDAVALPDADCWRDTPLRNDLQTVWRRLRAGEAIVSQQLSDTYWSLRSGANGFGFLDAWGYSYLAEEKFFRTLELWVCHHAAHH